MKKAIMPLLLLTGFNLIAQDAGRMDRDIEVAENVLAALFQEERVQSGTQNIVVMPIGGGAVEGTYLEGFGALFTLAGHNNWPIAVGWASNWNRSGVVVVPDSKEKEKEVKVEKRVVADTISIEKLFRDVSTHFLADYAFMLRQLPDNEKIMIRLGAAYPLRWGADKATTIFQLAGSSGGPGYSAAVKKSDVNALQNGAISREQFEKRIEFTAQQDKPGEADRDLVLLTSIFSRLYKSDMSEVFQMYGSPGYEKIGGLGAVFYLPMGSKNFRSARHSYNLLSPDGKGGAIAIAPTPEAQQETKEELAKKLDEAYPAFLAELKRNVVEYGSIVKNLAADEALIFRVELGDCKACKGTPSKVEITARQSTLEAYRKGNITLEAAAGQLNVVEKSY